ncbi:MAG: hypothetical protein KDM63_10990, partial [Verrucomicrobiae bacterium]|nr:hypothetical protein [Verrucomicrobiae bacterium]
GTIPTDILSRSTNDSDGDHMSDDWEIAHSLDPQVDDGDADPDHDDLTNYREYLWNADPRNPDSDGDGYPDGFERTHGFDPTEASDALTDSDNDELPDLWELTYLMNPSSSGDGSDDPDSDTLSNLVEFQSGTNPLKADTDGDGDPDDLELANQTNPLDRHDYTVVDDDNDGMHDRWETANGLNTSLNDADADDDQDGLSNAQEFQRGTRANSKDSDGDGYEDGFEVAQGYDPTSAADALFDSDGDGMTDLWELTYGLNINDPTDADGDTDSDGISNGDEFAQGTDPGVANGGSNGNGNGTMVDADGDGMSDTWEILNGLNQFDSSDASRDFDYDRISNLQEFLDGTSPNTNWTLQEVPLSGGVIGGVSTLNEMGELVRLNNGSLTVFRWEGDQWVDRGQFGGGVTVNALKQNNFGMTVGWNNGLGTAASQARVRNLNTGEVDSIAPLDAQSLKVLKVTDSGFVIGEFKGSDGRKRLFRYRNGYTDLLENPAGNLEYRDSNSVGQILAHFGSPNDVRAFIKDEWVAGVAPGAMKISDSGGFTSVSAGSPPLSLWRWFSNQQGDLVTGVIPGSISGVPPVHEGLFSANGGSWVLFDPVIPDPEHYARHVVPMGLSESGDVVGSFYWNQDDGQLTLTTGDPYDPYATYTLNAGIRQGFLWRPGGYDLLGVNVSSSYDSDFLTVNRSGQIAVSFSKLEDLQSLGTYDFAGDGNPTGWTYQGYSSKTALAIPTNDPDGNGLPDQWEMSKFGAAGQDPESDLDGDSLDVKGEYVFDTNPADPDTDDDSIPDGFEITFGMNPRVADSGEDFDGDGLTNLQEYQGGTDPLAADSDHDGLKDKWETDHGFNLIDPADGAADQDSDGMTNAWEVRHGLDYTNPADATQDPDEDDLTNKQEFDLGTDPNNSDSDGDGLNDGDEDNDGDGMPNLWEIGFDLDPLSNDGFQDGDGDRIPNLWEWARQTDPTNPYSMPTIDGRVDPIEPEMHPTLQAALDALTEDYSIIEVRSGVYSGNVSNSANPKKVLILGKLGGALGQVGETTQRTELVGIADGPTL